MGSGQGSGRLGCGATLARLLLFVVNICFWVCGAAVLGVGIWAKVDKTALRMLGIFSGNMSGGFIQAAVWVLIGVGAFIFVVGFLGCCGAWKKSTCMLWLYAFLLLLVIIVQIVAAILVIVFKAKVERELKNSLKKQIKDEYTGNHTDALSLSLDFLQWEFKCCGGENYTDYWNSKYTKLTNISVSKYCCQAEKRNFETPVFKNKTQCLLDGGVDVQTSDFLNTKGCYEGLINWVRKNSGVLIGVGVGIAVVEIISLVFACCLRSAIEGENKLV